MEKSNKFNPILSTVVAVVFMALLLTPFVLLITTGQDKVAMDQEKQYERPGFSLSEFWSAEFQNEFELWFSTKYPLRSKFVTAYRQLQYETSNTSFDIRTVFIPKVQEETPSVTTPVDTLEGETVETAPPEPEFTYSDFNPLYTEINKRLYERKPTESKGYKGTESVIIGKSGYCYENGYINEQMGYTQKYRDVTDEWLDDRVEKLTYIQKRLNEMGIAFTVIFTPSKASEYEAYIPDWYKAQNSSVDGYERPMLRLLEKLKESEVNYIFTPELFDEVGLDETFPITGIHWNKLAAVEATNALMDEYAEFSGETTKRLKITNIIEQKNPSGFGNPENDIFGSAYSGISTKDAIVDEYYYVPEVEVENEEDGERINVFLQGGSFCWDFKYYFQNHKMVSRFKQFYYNQWQGNPKEDPLRVNNRWEKALDKMDYVIFEVNEQMVCQMGCNAPRWGSEDKKPAENDSPDVYNSLYEYLKNLEAKEAEAAE